MRNNNIFFILILIMTSELSLLIDAKTEYTNQLKQMFISNIINIIGNIYKDSYKYCIANKNQNILIIFQKSIKNISQWTDENKRYIYEVLQKNECDWIDDLLTVVFISQIKIFTLMKKHKKKIDLNVPKASDFYFQCILNYAREIWKNPKLYYHSSNEKTKKDNKQNMIDICLHSIDETIRKMLPIKDMLKENISDFNTCKLEKRDLREKINDEISEFHETGSVIIKTNKPNNIGSNNNNNELKNKLRFDRENLLEKKRIKEIEHESKVKREAKEREAKEREAKEREAKEREAKEREAKEREAKEREAKERKAKEREAKEREVRVKEDKERKESKEREDKEREVMIKVAREREAKEREVMIKVAREREAKERQNKDNSIERDPRESDRRELVRRESDRRESDRRESDPRESDRRERDRREHEHKERDRREHEHRERDRREPDTREPNRRDIREPDSRERDARERDTRERNYKEGRDYRERDYRERDARERDARERERQEYRQKDREYLKEEDKNTTSKINLTSNLKDIKNIEIINENKKNSTNLKLDNNKLTPESVKILNSLK
jgi:hypothetical protein